jgi:hypothetical protein
MRDFNHTINILVQAYVNNTLKKGDCRACAVGNILGTPRWSALFVTCSLEDGGKRQITALPGCVLINWANRIIQVPICALTEQDAKRIEEAREAIIASGYTIEELARVENAFELAPEGNNRDEAMFNGLMAVVDVLADIHGIDLKQKEETRKLFVKT